MDHLQDALKLLALLGVQNALLAFGPALVNLINGLPGAGTDPIKLGLLWLAFKGDIAKAAPGALVSFESEIDTFIVAKIAGLQADVASAIAALSGTGTGNITVVQSVAQGPAAAIAH